VFLDTEHFAETVTFYTEYGAAGRTLTAIVAEQGQQKDDSGQHYLEGTVLHVTARRHATAGWLLAELKVGARPVRAADDDPALKYDFLEIVPGQSDAALLTARFRCSHLRNQGQRRPRSL
jgi:hypothetical protein